MSICPSGRVRLQSNSSIGLNGLRRIALFCSTGRNKPVHSTGYWWPARRRRILYVNFDHPLLKLTGMEAVFEAWRQRTEAFGPEFVFLDEAHVVGGWESWITGQPTATVVSSPQVPPRHRLKPVPLAVTTGAIFGWVRCPSMNAYKPSGSRFYRCPKSRAWLNCSPGRPLSFSAFGIWAGLKSGPFTSIWFAEDSRRQRASRASPTVKGLSARIAGATLPFNSESAACRNWSTLLCICACGMMYYSTWWHSAKSCK